jgi:hypothetical protein
MNSIDAPEPRHDLGVLFVHGIGQSKQGETLLNFGEPLRAAIEQLLEPADQARAVTAKVSAAWLSDPGDGIPARAELSIEGASTSGPDTNTPSRWLLAEAWWAEKFPTPTYGDIASWSFGALPATLISHFDRRFRRAGFDLVRVLRGDAALVPSLSALVRVVVEGLVLTLALAATPILLLMVAALLVLGLPPFKVTRDLAGSLQRTIAATVGDSFVFMRQAMTASAITTVVRERLEWLSARCRRVAVVAHSQGAAVAHRVLRSTTSAPCDLFVTFGSGLGKLSDIERGDIARGRAYLWLAAGAGVAAVLGAVGLFVRGWEAGQGPYGLMLPALRIFLIAEAGALAVFVTMAVVALADRPKPPGQPAPAMRAGPEPAAGPGAMSMILWPAAFAAGVGAVIALLRYGGHQPGAAYWGADETLSVLVAGGLAIAFTAIAAWRSQSLRSTDPKLQWLRDRELFASDYVLRNRDRMSWHDLHASADPVSNGRLLDEFDAPLLYSTQVFNEHSALFDHTTYWKATDDFVQRVARLLVEQTSLRVRNLTSYRAATRRRWRVRVLVWSRRALALEAFALALLWATVTPPWLSASFEALRPKPGPDASWWVTWSHAWLERLWPWLAALAVGAVAWWLLKRVWAVWGAREVKAYWEAIDYRAVPPELRLVLVLPGAGALAVGYAVWGFAGSAGLALLAVVAAALLWWPLRSAFLLASRSGTGANLDALQTRRLGRVLDAALRARDDATVTTTARQLMELDGDRAREALYKAAFNMKSPNAALALGQSLETAAARAADATRAQGLRDEALAAFRQGAALGDPVSAWYAAGALDKRSDREGALAMYRQAYQNGDALSAHSIGLALMKDPASRDEARAFYEEGARRGDRLSARFLARHYEELARDLEGDEAVAQKRKAVSQYRDAFDLGDVASAETAGRLLRELGDFPAAKRALNLGMRLRQSGAAIELGHLERDDEQDMEAARRAYREAIYLDTAGHDAGEALWALGQLLEAQQREKAAVLRYREVLRLSRVDKPTRAAAGLRLAALLIKQDEWKNREEAAKLLREAARWSPWVAGDAYVEHLIARHEIEAIDALVADDLATLSAAALLKLARFLRYRQPGRSQDLLRRATQPGLRSSEDADAAFADLLGSLDAESPEIGPLMDQVVSRGRYFTDRVVRALEADYRSSLASRLGKLVEGQELAPALSAAAPPSPPDALPRPG